MSEGDYTRAQTALLLSRISELESMRPYIVDRPVVDATALTKAYQLITKLDQEVKTLTWKLQDANRDLKAWRYLACKLAEAITKHKELKETHPNDCTFDEDLELWKAQIDMEETK